MVLSIDKAREDILASATADTLDDGAKSSLKQFIDTKIDTKSFDQKEKFVDKLKSDYEESVRNSKELEKKIEQKNQEFIQKEEDIVKLNQELEVLKKSSTTESDSAKQLTAAMEQLSEQQLRLEQALKDIETERQSASEASAKASDMEKIVEEKDGKLEFQTNLTSELKKELDDQKVSLTSQIDQSKRELNIKANEIDTLNAENKELEGKLKLSEEEADSLKLDMEKTKNMSSELNNTIEELNRLKEEMIKLEGEISSLKLAIEEKDKSISSSEESLKSLRTEIKLLKDDSVMKNKEAIIRADALKEQLTAATKNKEQYEASLRELKEKSEEQQQLEEKREEEFKLKIEKNIEEIGRLNVQIKSFMEKEIEVNNQLQLINIKNSDTDNTILEAGNSLSVALKTIETLQSEIKQEQISSVVEKVPESKANISAEGEECLKELNQKDNDTLDDNQNMIPKNNQKILKLNSEIRGLELEQLEKENKEQVNTTPSSPPPPHIQIIKAPHESDPVSPPGRPLTAEETAFHDQEATLGKQLEASDTEFTKQSLYLEKVIEHIVTMYQKIRENSEYLKDVSADIVKDESLVEGLDMIKNILSTACEGIKKISKEKGLDCHIETENIAKEIADIVKANKDNVSKNFTKIDNKNKQPILSKQQSARDILISEMNPGLSITTVPNIDSTTSATNEDNVNTTIKELEEVRTSEIITSEQLIAVQYQNIRAKLMKEKITDHIAIMADTISQYCRAILEINSEIHKDEETVNLLIEANKALSQLLNIPIESVREVVKNTVSELSRSGTLEDKELMHADTPMDSPNSHKQLITTEKHYRSSFKSEAANNDIDNTTSVLLDPKPVQSTLEISYLPDDIKVDILKLDFLFSSIQPGNDIPDKYTSAIDQVKLILSKLVESQQSALSYKSQNDSNLIVQDENSQPKLLGSSKSIKSSKRSEERRVGKEC